jgi:maltoporin
VAAVVTQIRVTLSSVAVAALAVGAPAPAMAQPDEPTEPAPEPAPEPEPDPEPEPVVEPEPQPQPEPPPEPVKGEGGAKKGRGKEGHGEEGAAKAAPKEQPLFEGSFAFGSYGRVIAASDHRGRPGRNADIVAHGSRLDHENYVELELRREDHWYPVDADTRLVATLALGHPIFHYDGEFDAHIVVRNLYLEERHLGLRNLSFWAGSRMLRGDDIYLLDFWPLDNLNTLGAGLRYDAETRTAVSVHVGLSQPANPFYKQEAERPAPLNQFGTATVDILDRQRWVGSLRGEQIVPFGEKAGLKVVLYGEAHQLPAGQRETSQPDVYEDVPHDDGWVVGGQLGAFTGERSTHVNVFFRYATGLAAYGEFAEPLGLGPDRTTSGASELLLAVGGNAEFGPVTVQLGGYLRSFRNASPGLDFEDVDEGIVIARPHVFFLDWLGLAVEGSYQAQARGVLAVVDEEQPDPEPLCAHVGRVGVIPFVTPAGRGSYSRPMFWFIYSAAFRDAAARALYPEDDLFHASDVEHFFGVGAEWWFGSTSYGDGR